MPDIAVTNAAPAARSRWGLVALAVLAGILVGLQVGKVPPALPAIRAELGLSLVAAGWVASLFNGISALTGVLAGAVADRSGSRAVLTGALAALALGGACGALAGDAGTLLAARFAEGVGFVGVVVAAPRLIVTAARPEDRPLALGFWSVYMPAGMAAAMALAPVVLPVAGWRGLWWLNVVLVLAFLALFARLGRGAGQGGLPARGPFAGGLARALARPGPWLLGAGFGVYTVQFFAVMAWLPTFLIERHAMTVATAGSAAAAVVLANVIGNLGGAWALHRGVRRWLLMAGASAGMGLAGAVVFGAWAPDAARLPAAFLFSAVGGLLPAAALAGSARHAPDASQVATVNGVIVQGSNLGSLVGPPAMAATVAALGGWTGAERLLLPCAALGCLIALGLGRIERRP